MKKKFVIPVLATALSFNTFASGIPVVDIASIAQAVQEAAIRVQEFQQTIQTAQNNLAAIKAQSNYYQSMVEGHISYEDILYDSNLAQLTDLSSWQDLYESVEDISDAREEFGLTTDNEALQRLYDKKLTEYQIQQKLYKNAAARNERISSLLSQFSTATTPATKADLANSINYQVAAMKNDEELMSAFNKLSQQKQQFAIDAENKEFVDNFFDDGIDMTWSE